MLQVLVFFLVDDLVLPAFGGEAFAFEYEEPVGYEEVYVGEDDGDGFHDVPGEVEVDEIVQDGDFGYHECRKPFDSFLGLSYQLVLGLLYNFFHVSYLLFNYLEHTLVHHLLHLQVK